jgi:hypothetical protein
MALLLVGCTTSSPSHAPPRPSPAFEPPAAIEAEAPIDTALDNALQRASALRELTPLGPIRHEFLSRDELVERAAAIAVRDTEVATIEGQTRLLIWLGLAPTDFDYLATFRALSESSLAGLYDPKEDVLYVAEDLDPKVSEEALLHELVHALQDQHFDLQRLLDQADTSDRQAAIRALAEGDALRATRPNEMRTIDTEYPESEHDATLNLIPEVIWRDLRATYRDGLDLIQHLSPSGDWARINALWRNPPTSTRALLHPNELESSQNSCLPDPLPQRGGPGTVIYDDVLGEQALRTMLEVWMDRDRARIAAAGWQSDRLTLFRDGNAQSIVWQLRFDEASDAGEALQGFVLGLPPNASTPAAASGRGWCKERPDRGAISLERRGRDIVLAGTIANASEPLIRACPPAARWARAILDTMK